jgi:hypothetical protein
MRIKIFRRYPVNGQKRRSPWHVRPLAKAFGVSSRHPVASRRRMAMAARREAKRGQTTKASWSYEQSKAWLASALRGSSKTIDIPASLWSKPLEAWQISVRLTGVLQRSGVRVLGELHGRKVGDFARKRNCGLKTLLELDSLVSVLALGTPKVTAATEGGSAKADARRAQSGAEKVPSAGNGTRSRRPARHTGAGRRRNGDARASYQPSPRFGVTSRLRLTRKQSGQVAAAQQGAALAIPKSVCQLQFHELPMTKHLANVGRSIGLRTLGDLNGRNPLELLQYRSCGWRTLAEIEQLIERAISGEFDVARIDESMAATELLTLVEQGIAKLSRRERSFLLARIVGLTFEEIGRRFGFTRALAHQVVIKALDKLRKSWGPRIPRLFEMMKRRCLAIPNASGLTPALLEQWMRGASKNFRLSRKEQVRLIAALDKSIPCSLD